MDLVVYVVLKVTKVFKETKEKQHAEIVAKRHKAALAKKKRD